ncbi:hypothetical protein BD779DRAFT_1675415 [Infundibulicybe gibba]|nr:hypothetical protein BD779DRAFT_1675415 [Infundibulicybe gibba]
MTLTVLGTLTLGTVFESIFYGAYVVLFVLCIVLRRRNSHRINGPLTLAQMLLFGLCTISMCLDISGAYVFVIMQDVDRAYAVEVGWLMVFITIDILAQIILLYRCWIVWDRRWVVVAVPGFLALVTLGQGFAYIGLVASPLQSLDLEKFGHLNVPIGITAYSISLGTNALTTSLIVTRILLTSRQVRPILGSNSNRSLRIVAAMMIESGLLMLVFQLAFVVLFSFRPLMISIISGPTAQIYGITPTLLNIRVMMGTTYDKTTAKTASLRFAHSGGAATQTTGQSISAAGVHSQGIDTGSDDSSRNGRVTDDAV